MFKLALAAIAALLTIAGSLAYLLTKNVAVLNPKGWIASEQRELIIVATSLMLVVVIPVFALTGYIAWKYRESNKQARFEPDWDHSRGLELLWWGIPAVIIGILSVITWRSAHALDPFKPLASNKPPLKVQVVATQWQWLFIYPDFGKAVTNELYLPINRPVEFSITSDAPMNSFWIPNLGGQIYAMPGMATKLHLIAEERGQYFGQSANISGKGFASMKFNVFTLSEPDFMTLPALAAAAGQSLDWPRYQELAKPTENSQVEMFALGDPAIFDKVINKYMAPGYKTSEYSMPAEARHE